MLAGGAAALVSPQDVRQGFAGRVSFPALMDSTESQSSRDWSSGQSCEYFNSATSRPSVVTPNNLYHRSVGVRCTVENIG